MFGDLFEEEEDFSFLSSNRSARGKKVRFRPTEPMEPRGPTKLSGIRNQGGTCYLNSLLQTLLFTPEFREALFSLGPEDLGSLDKKDHPHEKVRIIPLQLQRLFAQLLLLNQQAASTSDLTDSFGWGDNEETRQHDVQELNRILFCALESSLVGTSGHDLINQLYHGTVVNKIVCKECGNISERQEDFLDLTVAVKDVSSLEEALYNIYVEEELFDDDNLYRCSACNKLVRASKSAKLRNLPPFLTFSLLRFNFDFVKCERYKETNRYTFPLQINLKPFCEQGQLAESQYEYELFSVIIHKGGCYGGHYHAYIKDVDLLGNLPCAPPPKEVSKPAQQENKPETNPAVNMEEPLQVLRSLIAQEEAPSISVDHLGQKLLLEKGTSWNKMYRKKHGAIRKFLQSHPSVFLLTSDGIRVSLRPTEQALPPKGNTPGGKVSDSALNPHHPQDSESVSTEPRESGAHWFDFNDSTVQPISEDAIEKQFQGKESAYMLFYRQLQLPRPLEAKHNPRYKVPQHLLEEMESANLELETKRAEPVAEITLLELKLHLGHHYVYDDGALHPSSSRSECVLDFTIDQSKTLGDLRYDVYQLLGFWDDDVVLSVAKALPAGLHLYHTLKGDDLPLTTIDLTDGMDIFVWNGKEVGGKEIQTGQAWEPVVLNILHPAESGRSLHGPRFTEYQQVFPVSTLLGLVREALAASLQADRVTLCYPVGSGGKKSETWNLFAEEDMNKSIKDLGMRDGNSILILDADRIDQSFVNVSEANSAVSGYDNRWLRVQNFCKSQTEGKHVRIQVTADMVMSDVKMKAIPGLQMEEEIYDASDLCLRPIDKHGKLFPPVADGVTVEEAHLRMRSSLGLCVGKSPTSTQLFLYFVLGNDVQAGPELEILVEETISVKECLERMLAKAGLSGEDGWHLRKMDWCYEASEPLDEEKATLKELKICSGDTLVVTEGRLPPKGFLKVPIWLYQHSSFSMQQGGPQGHLNQLTGKMATLRASPAGDCLELERTESSLSYRGDLEISLESTLEDLKAQVMTLPSFQDFTIPSPDFLRIWTLDNKRLGRLLRSHHHQQQLSDYKLGIQPVICVQILPEEEHLGESDLLLRVQQKIPGLREYYSAEDMVWDISRECTARSLRQRIATHYSLPVEKLELAKHLPEKFEWVPISNWYWLSPRSRLI
ncbi:ubiquitin carboxyl-terminal hydrolase 40 isoform X2 [Ambystoma mexicanum]|uniref:ubiquitin carboxyl-terminal hydrolase 40 isoform X2 n=1 Tax=Ambystoma mexicanum TaxID=8296 RepID=UPI0037E75516